MLVLYPKISEWELSYIKNELLNKYNNINFYYYDNYFITESLETKLKENISNKIIFVFTINGILRISDYFNLTKLIDFLKPKIIISLSDEFGTDSYTVFSNKTNLFLYSYYHSNYNFSVNDYQIPLGYVSNYLENKSFKEVEINLIKIKDRKYNCSFVGQLKNDRIEMINIFKNNMEKCNIIEVINSWDLNTQIIKPNELFTIYNNSIFVLIGRGNKSLNCFRVYEAICAGAIPLIVGEIEEINNTFKFNGNAPYILNDVSWSLLVQKCLILLNKFELLEQIQHYNINWWNRKITDISKKIEDALI